MMLPTFTRNSVSIAFGVTLLVGEKTVLASSLASTRSLDEFTIPRPISLPTWSLWDTTSSIGGAPTCNFISLPEASQNTGVDNNCYQTLTSLRGEFSLPWNSGTYTAVSVSVPTNATWSMSIITDRSTYDALTSVPISLPERFRNITPPTAIVTLPPSQISSFSENESISALAQPMLPSATDLSTLPEHILSTETPQWINQTTSNLLMGGSAAVSVLSTTPITAVDQIPVGTPSPSITTLLQQLTSFSNEVSSNTTAALAQSTTQELVISTSPAMSSSIATSVNTQPTPNLSVASKPPKDMIDTRTTVGITVAALVIFILATAAVLLFLRRHKNHIIHQCYHDPENSMHQRYSKRGRPLLVNQRPSLKAEEAWGVLPGYMDPWRVSHYRKNKSDSS